MKKVLMVISILAAVAMAVLNLTYQFGPEPDGAYPMTDQRIEWNAATKNPLAGTSGGNLKD